MFRGIVYALLIMIALATASPAVRAAQPAFGSKPNIVFLITDDQGYGDLSCHGNPMLKTPNIDRLHRDSVRLTRFQVSPTCAPTRSALMSGRHEFYVGVTHTIFERERLALGVPTLPEMLRRAGYTTGIFGKWHLGDQDPYRPDQRGFDEVFIHGCGGIGQSYAGSSGDAPGNKYFDPWVLHNNTFEKTDGFCTDVFFRQALSWIDQQQRKKPFFAYITTNAPHGPLIAPDEYKKPFLDQGMKDGPAAYYGMIQNIDDNVGRLLAQLKQWNIDRETLVIFITDNGSAAGWSFNAGMKGKKGSVDEGGTRVPCFFHWPGVLEPGKDIDRIAAHLDMLPTLGEIVGAEPAEKEKLHGRSLVPLLKGSDVAWEDRYLFSHRGRWAKGKVAQAKYGPFSVRSQKWRMVGRESLYDMENDPGQKTNVLDKHPRQAAKMLAAYDRWWEGALPNMTNEDAPLEGPNTFKAMFYKQFGQEPPQPSQMLKPKKRKARAGLTWKQTDTSVTLLNNGKVVWQHVHDGTVGKPYMRFGLLDGTELTRPWPFAKDYPKADHTWHRALWWSFKAIDGVNFWEEHQLGTEPIRSDVTTNDDGSATIETAIAYHVPDQPPVVMEKRRITVGKPDAAGNYRIDWQATFTPAGKKDVVFNRNSYGGLAIRFAAELSGDTPGGPAAWIFFDSEDQKNSNGRNARWVAYRGIAANGRPAAVAMFDHPKNPRFPTPWQTRANYPYLNPSFTCNEDFTLPAGKSLTLRYGILVHHGPGKKEQIERQWKAFAATSAEK